MTDDDTTKPEKRNPADVLTRRVTGRFELDVPEPNCDKNKIEREGEPYLQSLKRDLRRRLRKTNFLLEIVGAVLILGYASIAALQWCAMLTANDQTKLALHVSQRAYITTASPQLDANNKVAIISLRNGGHIPSGRINIVAHEATGCGNCAPVEWHWKRYGVSAMAPGDDAYKIEILLPAFSQPDIEASRQVIEIAGKVIYHDGFPDDPAQQWRFCWQTTYQPILKQLFWTPCDPDSVLPEIKKPTDIPRTSKRASASGHLCSRQSQSAREISRAGSATVVMSDDFTRLPERSAREGSHVSVSLRALKTENHHAVVN